MFLVNSRLGIILCGPYCYGQTLLLTYGRFFAEFLGDLSLVRLALLELNTCVGFGTVWMYLCLEVFLESALPQICFGRGLHISAPLAFIVRIYLHDILTARTQIQ